MKSGPSIFWLLLHTICCLISLLLGFRFSRLLFFSINNTNTTPFHSQNITINNSRSSHVVVGRHGIRIRPWPHPNPTELMKAHKIIETVQRQQRLLQFNSNNNNPRKTVIVVTPTYVRTFQTLHLTGVMHSLMLVPYDVVWILVEAGGVTNHTAAIIAKSQFTRTFHIGVNDKMPISWEERRTLEGKMRLRALRLVREEKLDGIVMFADDSNMHSMELFDEIQNVKWFGALSIGILAHSGGTDESSLLIRDKKEEGENRSIPMQGPACDDSNKLVGWHTFNSKPYEGKKAVYIDDRATVLPHKLEWAGFVLNSRLLWREAENKLEWVNDLDTLDENIDSPLALVKDQTIVEPLGSCGRQVLLWWLRVEARSDSKFPPGWIIDPPLDVTVPSKHTPWPDTPSELPSNEKIQVHVHDRVTKHATKSRKSRRPQSKRKPLITDTEVSGKHSEGN